MSVGCSVLPDLIGECLAPTAWGNYNWRDESQRWSGSNCAKCECGQRHCRPRSDCSDDYQ